MRNAGCGKPSRSQMASPVPHPKDRALALVTLGNNGGLQTDAALEESGRACYGFLTFILRLPQTNRGCKVQRNTNPGSSLVASRLALHRHVNPHWIPAHFSRSTILKPILSPITVWLAKSAKNPKVSTHHQSVDRVKGWYLHQETGDNHQLHPTNYTKNLENDLLFGGKYRKIPIGRLNPTF